MKKALVLGMVLTLGVALAGCAESENDAKEVDGQTGNFSMIGINKTIREVKSFDYQDSDGIKLNQTDGKKVISTNAVTTYHYPSVKVKTELKTYLEKGRVGTFDPAYPKTGFVSSVGFNTKEYHFTSDAEYNSGEVIMPLKDGVDIHTNDYVTAYEYKTGEQRQAVENFVKNGRVGTIFDKAPSKGYVVVIGYNELEWHFATDVDTLDYSVEITLSNGLKIRTNDIVTKYEFSNASERNKLVGDYKKEAK